ncbi:WG repeat-containing protein [Apibacter raozihei]|uniref:WG repeat-containing protein n=1 Tax=Apibacter raozihei TaxID=2500547 RepID=UPI000FE31B95|nr:WG repeat-containing protein [Apibacter raozihei]
MKIIILYILLLFTYKTMSSQTINLQIFYDSNNVKFGLKNEKGEVQIPAQWDSLTKINSYFYIGKKSGFVYTYRYDESLNELIRINYKIAEPAIYSNHLVIVQPYGKDILKGVITIHGEEILPSFYSNIRITEHYILAEIDKKISVFDLQGKKIFSEKYNYIHVKDNYIYAKIDDNRFPNKEKYVVYTPQLKIITHPDWNIEGTFGKDGLLMIETLTKEKFYIDYNGNIKIPPTSKINFESPFSNGYAIISSGKTDKKFGFMNTVGEIVIPAEYDEVSPFQIHYAYFFKKNKQIFTEGLIDSGNKIKKIFPNKVISKSVYYDTNETTYYLSTGETYDADGKLKDDLHPIR